MLESYTTKYGVSSESYTWPAHKVDVDDHPEIDLIVYQSKSGWIAHDRLSGRSYGRIKAGVGWYGFGTKDEAVANFIIVTHHESSIVDEEPYDEDGVRKECIGCSLLHSMNCNELVCPRGVEF